MLFAAALGRDLRQWLGFRGVCVGVFGPASGGPGGGASE
jgi:hypothetical protein